MTWEGSVNRLMRNDQSKLERDQQPEPELPRCVVIGYAGEDHKMFTESFQGVGRTTIVRSGRGTVTEPGAVYFFARAMRRRDVPTSVVSWLGNDEAANRYASSLRELGVATEGLSFRGSRSPSAHMFYAGDGDVVSFYDPGDVATTVTESQRLEVQHASVVLIGVAPPEAVLEILAEVPADAWVTWAVKADPAAVTLAVARALAERADAICLSESEYSFLTMDRGLDLGALSRSGTIIVTTKGSEGAQCSVDGTQLSVPAPERIDFQDPTGAGDTFAAGLTAVLAFPPGSNATKRPTRIEVEHAVLLAESDAAGLIIERKRKYDTP